MIISTNYLGMLISPMHWAVFIVFAILLFAPKSLPPIGRFLGVIFGFYLRIRYDLPRKRASGNVEVLDPVKPKAPSRKPVQHPVVIQQSNTISPWIVGAVVVGGITVLLWYLLHAR